MHVQEHDEEVGMSVFYGGGGADGFMKMMPFLL